MQELTLWFIVGVGGSVDAVELNEEDALSTCAELCSYGARVRVVRGTGEVDVREPYIPQGEEEGA